ncbi:hypothetical protein G9A89_007470 [Geosiphon pyriformis]|nr:hypothetical protein G9A89_007470 [Geosiphon pyriformis]
MVTPNFFVVSDEIFGKISTTTVSSLSDIDSNSSSISSKIDQDQLLVVLSNVVLFSRSLSIPKAKQSIISDDLKDWANQIEIELTVSFSVFGATNSGA